VASLTRSTLDQLDASHPLSARLDGWGVFEELPAPSSADESWRYVELPGEFEKLDLPLRAGPELAPDPFTTALNASARVRIVDGHTTLAEGELVTADLGVQGWVSPQRDKLAAAHAAFVQGGGTVVVPRGRSVAAPIVIEIQASLDRSVSFPHLYLRLEDNSEADIVVVYRSADSIEAAVSPQLEAEVGDGARLRLLTVQELGLGTVGVIQQRVRLGRDAAFRMGEVGLGGALARLDLTVDLLGQGASSEVVGLFFGHRHQVLDYRMTINHSGRNTTSDVLLKGAVEDQAQSIFAGLVRIEKGAIRSSSFETNRNLVLSPEAKAHSIPNLEILCDDVMCGHGSSVGPLEEEHLYYLQSRGISAPRAERLLVRGFFREVIDRLPIHGLDDEVADVLERRFVVRAA
jgi:Fe-S cluster assembly protein SufD